MGEYDGEYSSIKGERRDAKKAKKRDRMDQGKKVKLLDSLTIERAIKAGAKVRKEENR